MTIKLLPVRSFLFSFFCFRYEVFRFRFLVCYEEVRNKTKKTSQFLNSEALQKHY